MSSLVGLRDALATDLSDLGVPVHSGFPDRFNAPCILVMPSDPYVSSGQTFGEFDIKHDVIVVAGTGTPTAQWQQVSSLAEDALLEVNASEYFSVESMSKPAEWQIGQSTYLAVIMRASVQDDLESS